jgi:hypothetical protein
VPVHTLGCASRPSLLSSLPVAAVAVIGRKEIIDRILQHLSLPLRPDQLGDSDAIALGVTGQPTAGWALGLDPEPPDAEARGPPSDHDAVDAPAPED